MREVGRVGCERCGGAVPQQELPNTPDPTNEWPTKRKWEKPMHEWRERLRVKAWSCRRQEARRRRVG